MRGGYVVTSLPTPSTLPICQPSCAPLRSCSFVLAHEGSQPASSHPRRTSTSRTPCAIHAPGVLLATLLGGARRPRVKEGRAARGDRLPAQPMTGVCPAPPSRPGAEGRARGGRGSGPSKEFRGSQEAAPSSPRPGCAPSGPLLRSQPQFPPIQGSPQWVPTVRGMGACRRVGGQKAIRGAPGRVDQSALGSQSGHDASGDAPSPACRFSQTS